MKIAIIACLAAVALASPQFSSRRRPVQQFQPLPPVPRAPTPTGQRAPQRFIAITRDERQDSGNGEFRYDFEAENGISESRTGYRGSRGQTNMRGSYRFPLPDGTFAEVNYIADENGFRAESPLIPTPHPLPAHAIEQIRFAEEQRARGVTFPDY